MDALDHAQVIEEMHRKHAMERHFEARRFHALPHDPATPKKCRNCTDEIPRARLLAVTAAELCADCQRDLEKRPGKIGPNV